MHTWEVIERDAKLVLKQIRTEEELREFELKYLGRKQGKLTVVLRGLKNLPPAERVEVGKIANKARAGLMRLVAEKREELRSAHMRRALESERIDISLPGPRISKGHVHPLTKIRRRAEAVFLPLGFEVVEGQEIESEYNNFDALNIPADHPARDLWDTFWIKQDSTSNDSKKRFLLRTHISSLQVPYMRTHNPPFRMVAPGPVYRYEASDASHDLQFDYMEGLMVDRDISVANLKHLLMTLFRSLLSSNVEIRLRPSYFPFVEPGFEIDVSCTSCRGKGCSVCKQSGWVEIAGAGMVHAAVFRAAGYVPGEWQGAAFGIGLDRIAMMKYKIPDIRYFRTNDIRFLKQF